MSSCSPLIPGNLSLDDQMTFASHPTVLRQSKSPGSAPGVPAISTPAQTMAVSLCYLRSCNKIAYFHAF